MPRCRLDFEAKVFASGQRPEKIGLQPWETTEVWERLKAALREYRILSAAGQDTRPVEQAFISRLRNVLFAICDTTSVKETFRT